MSKSAAIVIIGDEILSGQIEDCNSFYFTRELRELGVVVKYMAVIPDDVDEIAKTVRSVSEKYDLVFTSGGIGPTHDDVTIDGIAKAFDVKVVRDPSLEKMILDKFEDKSAEAALKMSEIPEGATLLNENGLKFPLIEFRNVFIFPGIPEYLKTKFEAIKERFRDKPFYVRKIFVKMHESDIAPLLEETLSKYDGIKIGSYPKVEKDGYSIKITIESKDRDSSDSALEHLKAKVDGSSIIKVE
ncbi:MAG: competence/damage-inducible protein A [Nitrospirota bacterium]|nr:MAG: competence/damage-inducible protein A [Nitrospirota bacterium]